MELYNIQLSKLLNLTAIKIGDSLLNVSIAEREESLTDSKNIAIRFTTDKLTVLDGDYNGKSYIESSAVLSERERYPKHATLDDIASDRITPTIEHYYKTYLDFIGEVVDVRENNGLIDRFSDDLKLGKIVTIKTKDLTFDLNYTPEEDIQEVFAMMTNKDFKSSKPKRPSVGDYVQGKADVIGILF